MSMVSAQKDNKEDKPKLSPEEAKKQAEEVLRKAREKREVRTKMRLLTFLKPVLPHLQHNMEQSLLGGDCKTFDICGTMRKHPIRQVALCNLPANAPAQ